MIVYPAIDIKGGKCIRLFQGQETKQTIYYENPVEAALKWQAAGASYLHVIDLDGAFGVKDEDSLSLKIIERIKDAVSIPIQVGGGIRSLEKIAYLLDKVKVDRVILGTIAITEPSMVEQALSIYGEKIAVGVDSKEGKVAIKGWVESAAITCEEFASSMEAKGVKTLIFTSIARDGTLGGPDIDGLTRILKAVSTDVILAGGMGKPEDVVKVKRAGASGVVIGKALYTGDIDLTKAISLAKEEIC